MREPEMVSSQHTVCNGLETMGMTLDEGKNLLANMQAAMGKH